jgi:hypothetical protein
MDDRSIGVRLVSACVDGGGRYLPGVGLRCFSSEFWPDLVQSAECLVGECDLECAVAVGDLLDGAGR